MRSDEHPLAIDMDEGRSQPTPNHDRRTHGDVCPAVLLQRKYRPPIDIRHTQALEKPEDGAFEFEEWSSLELGNRCYNGK